MKHRAPSIAILAAAAVLGPASAPAYYHFITYLKSGNAPQKFDLTALPNKTVAFFVSESGPVAYTPPDTFNSVLSQVEQATAVWNGVSSSDLRIVFGGLENGSTPQNTPGGDVSFEDLPPGVEGFGGPTTLANPITAADGSQFYPIVRSVVHLSLNLTVAPGPSYDQSFLMTTIHEIGHAVGLQHTFTSASMSQATTRATTLAHPISADDVAGISVLYPNANFAQFGSISGAVTVGGQGVHMASVVAIQTGLDAISTVTNPDGTFRMDGVPPGEYAIYVHTMPPDADIFGPWNADGTVAPPSGAINTVFYSTTNPGTTTFSQATLVPVVANKIASAININAVSRASVPLYDGQIYGYFNNYSIVVTPAPVTISTTETPVVASIVGLGTAEPASKLSVQLPGGSASVPSNGIVPYSIPGYAAVYLNFNANSQPGQQHIIFNTPDYTYVLPSAMFYTLTPPPTVAGIQDNGDGTSTVTGTNWVAATLLYFDGLPATIKSLDLTKGAAVVVPPTGSSGQQSTLTAYNPDGQNSQILQSASPITWSYGKLPTPAIAAISPASLPAGAEAMIDITGSNLSLVQGTTTIGFGTTDVAVQRVFVLSPNHVQVDVLVPANAALSNSDVSVISGFQVTTAPAAFQITAAVPGLPAPNPSLTNASPGLTGAYAGATVRMVGTNLAVAGAFLSAAPTVTPTVTLAGEPVTILSSSPAQITFQIPADLPPGPAALIVNNGTLTALPIEVNIDTLPAAIAAIQDSNGNYIYAANPAQTGETLIVTLTNFAAAGATIDPRRVQVGVGGVNHSVTKITDVLVGTVNYSQVTFQLNANDPVGQVEPFIVYLDGRSSYPAAIPVSNPDGTFTQSGTQPGTQPASN
jgi:uncharacterized protein (TIGR03437 family)